MTDAGQLFGPAHVESYRATGGEVGHIWRGVPTLLLTTTGRRTGERPDALPVERDLVFRHGPGLEPVDDDERVVVPVHVEGGGPRADHLHLARTVGLDPDDGVALADVAEERAEDESCHAGRLPGGPLPYTVIRPPASRIRAR